jgi:hypothetical protein
LGDGIAAAKIEKHNARAIKSSGLRQAPQDLNRFLGRVSSGLVLAYKDGCVRGRRLLLER